MLSLCVLHVHIIGLTLLGRGLVSCFFCTSFEITQQFKASRETLIEIHSYRNSALFYIGKLNCTLTACQQSKSNFLRSLGLVVSISSCGRMILFCFGWAGGTCKFPPGLIFNGLAHRQDLAHTVLSPGKPLTFAPLSYLHSVY